MNRSLVQNKQCKKIPMYLDNSLNRNTKEFNGERIILTTNFSGQSYLYMQKIKFNVHLHLI